MVVSTPAIIAPIGRGDTVTIGYCTIRRGWLYLDLGRAHESSKKEAQLSRADAHYYPARYRVHTRDTAIPVRNIYATSRCSSSGARAGGRRAVVARAGARIASVVAAAGRFIVAVQE